MQVIGDIARLNAKRYPDNVALTMENESLAYRQANQIANGLVLLGVRPEALIGAGNERCKGSRILMS